VDNCGLPVQFVIIGDSDSMRRSVPPLTGQQLMSTGLWNEPGVPHKGWTCVGTEDLREDDPDAALATCQMCKVQEIRYVHHMTHPDYTGGLDVGCVCAEKMEEDYTAARRREAPLRSRAARRSKWLTRKWKRSQGRDYIESFGYRTTVLPVSGGWGGAIVHIATGRKRRSTKVHATADDAKLAAFDTIEIFRAKD
jgi:hypothetical protein